MTNTEEKIYQVELYVGNKWVICGVHKSLSSAINHFKMLGEGARITVNSVPLQPTEKPKIQKPQKASTTRFVPYWLSSYIALSISLCGDMSLAYDLLLKEYYDPEKPERAKKMRQLAEKIELDKRALASKTVSPLNEGFK